eukprot:TRINITY_DN7397_c1_g1_i1.p1 TRINITY_DN7397_c1_g1~~TRINITY_DN7397_c1_g1_i1.p1  ORF type:complete len:501 (+),score=191.17 TRINITY_DN7397_c1_g1_i1:1007-2509(+)
MGDAMKTLLSLLVILVLLTIALPARAETILVLGRAPLGANQAAAKEAAVADALSRAVARAASTSLDPVTLRNNLAVLDQQVLSDAKRYITNYTLVASATSGDDYLALVQVSIDQRALTRSLIRAALKLPTSHMGAVLVMVSEETAPGRPPVYWWSGLPGAPDAPAPLVKVIKHMGIRVINPQPLKALLTPDMRQPVLSEAQALEFARQAGAQVVLLGSVRTYPLVTPDGVSPPPLVQLLAIDTKSGQVMSIEEQEGPSFHTTPPAEEYSKILGMVETSVRNLMAKLSARMAELAAQSKDITLKVSGVRSLPQLMRLEKVLLSLGDLVDKAQRVSAGAGKASFLLTLKGTPSQLADQLMVHDYGDFLVNVVEQDAKNVEAVIIPRQPEAAPSSAEPSAQDNRPMLEDLLKKDDQAGQEQPAGAAPAAGQEGAQPAKPQAAPAKEQKFPWEQEKSPQSQMQKQQPAPQPGTAPAAPAAPQKFPWEQNQNQAAPSAPAGASGR